MLRLLKLLVMGPMKGSSNTTGKGKRKVVKTTIELKNEIIGKFENSVRFSALAIQYSMVKSTILIFLKNKNA